MTQKPFLTITIDGMGCQHCVASVRKALEGIPDLGVDQVEIGSARVRLPRDGGIQVETILQAVRNAGYTTRLEHESGEG